MYFVYGGTLKKLQGDKHKLLCILCESGFTMYFEWGMLKKYKGDERKFVVYMWKWIYLKGLVGLLGVIRGRECYVILSWVVMYA